MSAGVSPATTKAGLSRLAAPNGRLRDDFFDQTPPHRWSRAPQAPRRRRLMPSVAAGFQRHLITFVVRNRIRLATGPASCGHHSAFSSGTPLARLLALSVLAGGEFKTMKRFECARPSG